MARRREVNVFSLSFLDLISGALGAVIILYVAVPKGNPLQEKMDVIVKDVKSKDQRINELESEVKELKALQAVAKQELENQAAAETPPAPVETEEKDNSTEGLGLEVGFKFKGKNIVFILDTSKSMEYEDNGHDRMGQVKAGLKMLLMSMPASFQIEVVQFPNADRSPFKPFFGRLKPLSLENKLDIIDYLYAIRPFGGTPTRDALNYAFATYNDMTDIVLLSDGEPSLHQSNIKDDIYEILTLVRGKNSTRKVQINTIGVGSDVLHDKTAKPYQFLRQLAEQNGGFFLGF